MYLARDLRTLSLADNGLREFPADLCRKLTNLVSLDLSRNEITALPPQFRRLDHLVVLNLSHNPLENWTLLSVFELRSVRRSLVGYTWDVTARRTHHVAWHRAQRWHASSPRSTWRTLSATCSTFRPILCGSGTRSPTWTLQGTA